ncbi:hypothetical protein [Burkholderia gladioli]|uniref:hypothetical protein n=1 Tax=Burkholderia gladioli TaxID=28095 RepID=UPI0016405E58|nr:hypothetical protein [Burkholderia gladioli]
MNKPTKIRHLMTVGGQTGHYESDLVWIDGKPTIVLEWLDFPTGETIPHPSAVIHLDPALLFDLPGWGDVTHGYHAAVVDPRNP